MRHLLLLSAILAAIVCHAESVGLVLSGGGAKGIAHIGVIQALEDNDIPIDYVTGTSMGAIVGGLYAAGYTPAEMMELIESKGFASWSTGQIECGLTYFFDKSDPVPSFITVNFGLKDSTVVNSILPSSLINPLPMNFAFMDLFARYTAQCGGDFDNLFVPFRCVTSDVYHKHKIVCAKGSLGDAIRASMSFPVVFQPIEMDGVLVYDGGIYDNFPVDVMRDDFAPDVMIGVDVSEPDGKPKANDIIDQLEDMIIQNNDYDLPADEGIRLHLYLEEFGILDFPRAGEIYKIGYDFAMAKMDSIKARVRARVPAGSRERRRDAFKALTPVVRFDSVTVTGATKDQNEYIRRMFTARTDTFGLAHTKEAYYRAITSGKIKNLVPEARYNEATGLFDLALKATVKNSFNVGVGGFLTSSTNSMIFLSAGYSTLSFNSIDADINGWIGQSYMAGSVNARYRLRTPVSSCLKFEGVLSRQKFYESENLFYKDDMPTFITSVDNFLRFSYSVAAGRNGAASAGVGYGYLSDRFYPDGVRDYASTDRDYANYRLGQVRLDYRYNTLDNQMYPSAGMELKAVVSGMYGRYTYCPYAAGESRDNMGWIQAEVDFQKYFDISNRFAAGIETNAVYSSKKLLADYTATIVAAPAFYPTPSSYNAFNPAFRADSYITLGLLPIVRIADKFQLRGEFHGFMPFRKIKKSSLTSRPYYGRWFSDPEFFGELSLVYNLPFASLNLYGNYATYPASNWNFGISFGLFFLAPKFLR
ncbi:MAG: patatin-like phospholipase family protein [Pseudoflavonifractor sp.]|nr:patatin-like phospholipase family protein [Pseudoflavonifractor sp.]